MPLNNVQLQSPSDARGITNGRPDNQQRGLPAGTAVVEDPLVESVRKHGNALDFTPQYSNVARRPVSRRSATKHTNKGLVTPNSPPVPHYYFDDDVITVGRAAIRKIAGPLWTDRSILGPLANKVSRLTSSGHILSRLTRADNYPSYELRGRDPQTSDPREAVAVWLSDHASKINDEAAKRGIDPIAIAGAIAWEALENPYATWLMKRFRPNSEAIPGKIHPPKDWTTSTDPLTYHREIETNWTLATEIHGNMPRLTQKQRTEKLVSDSGSIEYIGAIFELIAEEAEANGFRIRAQPGILTWAYHGSNPVDWFNLLSAKAKMSGTPFKLPSDMMGGWVETNQQYLKNALNQQ